MLLMEPGITVMDENREFDNNTEYVNNMGSMVKRDRNHPCAPDHSNYD
jgi:hypothetical protein